MHQRFAGLTAALLGLACVTACLTACGGGDDNTAGNFDNLPVATTRKPGETDVETTEPPQTETTAGDDTAKTTVSIDTTPVEEAGTWQAEFAKVLRSKAAGGGYSNPDAGSSCSMYDLRDLDGDGTPELLVSMSDNHAAAVSIYTFTNGTAAHATDVGSYGTFDFDRNSLFIKTSVSNNGQLYQYFSKFDGRSVTAVDSYFTDEGNPQPGQEISYVINNQVVPFEQYSADLSKYDVYSFDTVGRCYIFTELTQGSELVFF